MIYEELTKSILVFKNLSDDLINDMIDLKNNLTKASTLKFLQDKNLLKKGIIIPKFF